MSCGWHVVGKFRFVFILTSSTDLISLVVLPTNVLQEGRTFRTLGKQTEDLLGANITPSVSPQMQLSGSVFDNFVRSFWSSLAKETSALRQLLLKQSDMNDFFGGPRLRDNVDSILSAKTPQVREVLNDGRFSLQDLLDLSHVYRNVTLPGPCVYVRVYTHLEGQSADSHGDATDGGISLGVAFYVGKAKDIWRRARQHETNTENRNVASLHYSTARKASREHRHMIPLIVFQQATVSEAVMNMAEQTMVALEGIVYQEPLNGFAKEVIIGQVDLLQTDHLNQRYRGVTRPKKALPAPARATWEYNFNLMHRLFDTPLTHVGTSEPLGLSSDVVNREMSDLRGGKMEFKCDTCNYMAAYIICTRDEEEFEEEEAEAAVMVGDGKMEE
ncbi:hypothetical protein Neosp_004141 [[Neocosmospora] mangrovei]